MKAKIKQLAVILILLTASTPSLSQNVFPSYSDNPTWNVLECFWYPCSTYVYQYQYDTTFCNKNYSKILSLASFSAYIHSDSIRTTIRTSTNCNDKEYLLYDYSLNIGDTAYMGNDLDDGNMIDTNAYILTSIDTVTQFGVARQRFKMLFDRHSMGFIADTMYWIKGIGSETHPFYSIRCMADFCEQRFTLLCYDSTVTQLYMNTFYNTCDTTISVGLQESLAEQELIIEQNPFRTSTRISFGRFNEAAIRIFDVSGKLQQSEIVVTGSIIGDKLKPGLYLLEIRAGQYRVVRKIVKL